MNELSDCPSKSSAVEDAFQVIDNRISDIHSSLDTIEKRLIRFTLAESGKEADCGKPRETTSEFVADLLSKGDSLEIVNRRIRDISARVVN